MNHCTRYSARPDLPIGYVGLSLGAPTYCGPHRVNYRYMIGSINIPQQFLSELFMKFSFIQLIRFRGDNARVFK